MKTTTTTTAHAAPCRLTKNAREALFLLIHHSNRLRALDEAASRDASDPQGTVSNPLRGNTGNTGKKTATNTNGN